MGMSCPRYDELLTETLSSNEVQTEEIKNKVGNGEAMICRSSMLYYVYVNVL